MADPTRVLAFDFGTSSARAVVCDAAAEPIGSLIARRAVPPRQDATGAGELDPDRYLGAVVACLDDLQAAGALRDIALVATSSQWHSVLALSEGRPVSPVLTWMDTRSRPTRTPTDPGRFHRRTGTVVHPLYWTAKIPFLSARHDDELTFAGLTEYIRWALLGDDAISLSMASGTGMLDTVRGTWDEEALDLAGADAAHLPEVADRPARLTTEYARRWPDLAGVDWVPALGDGASSTIGAGAFAGRPTAGVTVGTSAAIRVVSELGCDPGAADDDLDLDPMLWRYRVDGRHVLTGAAVSAGGVLFQWLTALLGHVHEPTDPPGIASRGVTVTPLHAGARPPDLVAAGSGIAAGLRLDTGPDQLVAATYEGVAFELLRALERLDATFGDQVPVVLGGGAIAASPWWRRAIAAAFDRTVRFQEHPEVGARGAAAHALGLAVAAPEDEVTAEVRVVAAMREARERFDRTRSWSTHDA